MNYLETAKKLYGEHCDFNLLSIYGILLQVNVKEEDIDEWARLIFDIWLDIDPISIGKSFEIVNDLMEKYNDLIKIRFMFNARDPEFVGML